MRGRSRGRTVHGLLVLFLLVSPYLTCGLGLPELSLPVTTNVW